MTSPKNLLHIFLFIVLGCLLNCKPKKETGNKSSVTDGVEKTYNPTGELFSEVTMKDGKRNGMARDYFKNGKVFTEVNYKEDKRDGTFKQYYDDGTISKEIDYKDDLQDGWSKKYRKDGTKAWQARFTKDMPCSDLTEYYLNGARKTEYPRIVIEPIDELRELGDYTLKISMSDKTNTVTFYEGKLTSEGCFDRNKVHEIFPRQNGFCKLHFHLAPGGFLMEEISIIAVVKTQQGNSYITTRSYNLAINN